MRTALHAGGMRIPQKKDEELCKFFVLFLFAIKALFVKHDIGRIDTGRTDLAK